MHIFRNIFRAILLHQCKIIKECIEIVGENISSGSSMDKLPNHDFVSLGNIFNKFRELSAVANNTKFSLNLRSFVDACKDTTILKTLMEHTFLHQGFHQTKYIKKYCFFNFLLLER